MLILLNKHNNMNSDKFSLWAIVQLSYQCFVLQNIFLKSIMGKTGGHAYPDPLFKKKWKKNILSTVFLIFLQS